MHVVSVLVNGWLEVCHLAEDMRTHSHRHVWCNKPYRHYEIPEYLIDDHRSWINRGEKNLLFVVLIDDRPIECVDERVVQVLVLLVLIPVNRLVKENLAHDNREDHQHAHDDRNGTRL